VNESFAQETDPDNRLLWHASQRRLDAEAIRDAMLAASGQLDATPPNGSVVASVGDGYIGKGIRPEIFSGYEGRRRSVYLPIVRDFVPVDEAVKGADWSRFAALPAFEAAHRINAYGTYLQMEREALAAPR
jgi:hypothetical protein